MRRRLPQDVWVLIGLLVLLVVIGFASGKARRGGDLEVIPRRTSYSTSPGGVKALYETLGKLGYRTERHLHALTAPPPDGVLFIIAPEVPVSDDEWSSLRKWVERGNVLVMASGSPTLDMAKTGKSTAACPSFLAADVRSYITSEIDRINYDEWSFSHSEDFAEPG